MASLDNEQEKTAGKMSDLVMEYVSQFIARDYLEAYERIVKEERCEFVPPEFDEKIYKKITKLIRKKTGYNIKLLRNLIYVIVALVCAACVAFTLFVMLSDAPRHEILTFIGVL